MAEDTIEIVRAKAVDRVVRAGSFSAGDESYSVDDIREVAEWLATAPDVLTYRPGSKASYAVEGLNGRALHDDAMNTVLQLMTGVAVDDNADDAKRYTARFPYILPVK